FTLTLPCPPRSRLFPYTTLFRSSRKPIEAWHPEWHVEEDAAEDAQQIIGVDSLATARAIHGNPSTSSEIKEMFDGITYEKGGARSEEHTSELQSPYDLVCRLLLE